MYAMHKTTDVNDNSGEKSELKFKRLSHYNDKS